MSSRARQMLALTGVVTLHAGVLLILFAETRTRLVPTAAEAPPLLLMLLSSLEPQRSAGTEPRRRSAAGHQRAREAQVSPEEPAPGTSSAPAAAVDWLGEISDAAARQAEAEARRRRQARALAPDTGMFAPPPPRIPGLPWNYAATHRVEPLGGLTTAIHINDNCGIVLFIVIPFAGGCTLDKIPARGDLFDHMHSPSDDGPQH